MWRLFSSIILFILALVFAQEVPRNMRVDCMPRPNANKEECISLGCWWYNFFDQSNPTVPLCYLTKESGYTTNETGSILILYRAISSAKNPFGTDISPIYFSTSLYGDILNIRIGATGRYEPTIKLPKKTATSSDPFVFEKSTSGIFSFAVRRKSTSLAIWDTSIGGLIFSDKFIQIATYLPSDKVYGFGENIHQSLKHNFTQYTTWGMFARDEPPNSDGNDRKNLYGVHPFYLALEPDGKAHGVLIWNSNAQEITTGPAPHLVYRTIGGYLDIYFFPGPGPEEVIKQYLNFIGTPFLPAYYALGFQLSRYAYKDLNEMMTVVSNVQSYGIPLDIPYADIDYMDRYKDFTLGQKWSEFKSYAQNLHSDGLHLFLIFDPAIQVNYATFQRGIEMNASFIEWERFDQVPHSIQDLYPLAKNTKVMLGVVWPDAHVAFPDFLDPTNKTAKWWINEFKLYHDQVPFDGIWIDMNEPANFGTNEDHPWYYDNDDHPNVEPLKCPLSGSDSEYDMPLFQTANAYYFNEFLAKKTLCMCALTNRGTERLYNTKNLYGLSEAIATQTAIYESTGKRGAIISRSTFPSSGHYTGHWLGDNSARWVDLKTSVIGAQEFNLFGIPYVGSDICGFIGETTEELCLRWQQMGAFHPFSRNHNDNTSPPQDPAHWPSVAAATKKANLFRYYYLPYLFTLHFEASLNGGTVIRPIFFEFPLDFNTHDQGFQFLWGSGMMIIPILTQGVTTITAYIPVEANWYSLRDSDYGTKISPGYTHFDAPTTDLIPVLARGGVIIPRQAPNTTTTASRKNPFELLIPLSFDGSSGQPLQANGKLYWDDGESIVYNFETYNYFHWKIQFDITSTQATLTIQTVKKATGLTIPTLDIIDIFGYDYTPQLSKTQLNGKAITINTQKSSYNQALKRLYIETANLINLNVITDTILTWPHTKNA